jgi:large subunit ribosomal protein L29
MAKKKKTEIRDLTAQELVTKVEETRKELFGLRSDRATRKGVEKTHLFRQKRRDIARMLTFLRLKGSATEQTAVESARKGTQKDLSVGDNKKRAARKPAAVVEAPAEEAPVAKVRKPRAKKAQTESAAS